MDNFDVIVVGAGNGGLVAAATVAQAGYKTLLLEKHNIPGGCATSFVRGRFEFEAALHELCDSGTIEGFESIREIVKNLGASVPLIYEDTLFRAISKEKEGGYDVVLHTGRQRFLDDMETAVPGCRKSVENLLDLSHNIDDAQLYMAKGKLNPITLFRKYSDFMRVGGYTIEEVEKALGIPEKARDIINTYWTYIGLPTDEINGMHYLSMLAALIDVSPSVPYMRSHELSLALINALQRFGGKVRYNTEVSEFLYDEQGTCIGVVANGQKLFAKKVIADICPTNVINRSDSKAVPSRMKKIANARVPGLTFITLYIGLDASMEEIGIKDYSVFISEDSNSRKQYDKRKSGQSVYIVNCLNKTVPNASPDGTSMLFFTIPYMPEDFPEDINAQNYKEYKDAYAERYIKDYEKTMGVSVYPHIEEIAIATPVTFARYLATPAGAVYGYQTVEWDNIVGRTAMEKAEYTIKNLHFCGGHHVRGVSYPSAYVTGDKAAQAVIGELKEGK